jgi:phosphoribosyl 1,2-cyclic phosphodiesterase
VRFASLGSGSKGNATLIHKGKTIVLLDCGFSLKETELRLKRLDIKASQICAIVVTHEHGDHIRGVGPLARKYEMPVFLTRGTASCKTLGTLPTVHHIDVHNAFSIDELQLQPYPVPHDAKEPCQFVFSDGLRKLGILTDTGSITTHIEEQLNGCHALLLECNHDADMLAEGSYPLSLKQRVGGRFGHLSNDQAAGLLKRLDTSNLNHLIAAHISEQNNTPQFAKEALWNGLGFEPDWIDILDQDEGFDWCEI